MRNLAPASGPPLDLYVIVNGKVAPDFAVIQGSTLSIVTRSFFTTVKANTRNTLIATHAFARRNGWLFNMTAIPHSTMIATTSIDFDTAYMRKLFALGRQLWRENRAWNQGLAGIELALPHADKNRAGITASRP